MKYQILLLYLLFTLPNLAQETLYLSITGKSNETVESYAFKQNFDATFFLNKTDEFSVFDNMELISYHDNGSINERFFFNEKYPVNTTIVDQKIDGFSNKYLLSSKTINSNTILVLQKYSYVDVLLWEYTIECFDNSSFIPNNITILNDKEIFVSCYKQMLGSTEKESSLFCINAEGDFLSEIAFK
jgi:hypothetical protein